MHRQCGFARAVAALALILGLLLGLAGPSRGDDKAAQSEGVTAKAAFKQLKSMVGTWSNKVKSDHPLGGNHDSKIVYKLTGAGSALVETDFPGAAHEMVSVYHLDGDDLRLTHYCAAGNQPRLKLDRARSTLSKMIFVFDGGTNLDADTDMHIHGLVVTFQPDGHVDCAWDAFMNGKSTGTTLFQLSRVQP
jgi:hypothetical protein